MLLSLVLGAQLRRERRELEREREQAKKQVGPRWEPGLERWGEAQDSEFLEVPSHSSSVDFEYEAIGEFPLIEVVCYLVVCVLPKETGNLT